jgi:hypothetical protein
MPTPEISVCSDAARPCCAAHRGSSHPPEGGKLKETARHGNFDLDAIRLVTRTSARLSVYRPEAGAVLAWEIRGWESHSRSRHPIVGSPRVGQASRRDRAPSQRHTASIKMAGARDPMRASWLGRFLRRGPATCEAFPLRQRSSATACSRPDVGDAAPNGGRPPDVLAAKCATG